MSLDDELAIACIQNIAKQELTSFNTPIHVRSSSCDLTCTFEHQQCSCHMLWRRFFNQQPPRTNPTTLATTTTHPYLPSHHVNSIPVHTNPTTETTPSAQEGRQPPNKRPRPPNNDNNTTHRTQPPQNDNQRLWKAPTTTTSTPHSPRRVNDDDYFVVVVIVYGWYTQSK